MPVDEIIKSSCCLITETHNIKRVKITFANFDVETDSQFIQIKVIKSANKNGL